MPEFRVVEGKLSEKYNSYNEFRLAKITATDTRLMGVVALLFEWESLREDGQIYQIIHLDFSEYGIDDYSEFRCMPDETSDKASDKASDKTSDEPSNAIISEVSGITFRDLPRRKSKDPFGDMEKAWKKMTGAMGGKLVEISAEHAFVLIDTAVSIYRKSELYNSGRDNHEKFREDALREIAKMKEALGLGSGFGSGSNIDDEEKSEAVQDAYLSVIPEELSVCETIHYFLIRLTDLDFSVLPILTDISEEELADSKICMYGLQSVIKNTITQVFGEEGKYECRFITLGAEYYYGLASFTVGEASGDETSKEKASKNGRNSGRLEKGKITDFKLTYFRRMSPYETAVQTKRPEYITVYELGDDLLESLDIKELSPFEMGISKPVINGFSYTLYNKDNSHVDRLTFYLSGDIYASALISMAGELVVMSYYISDISKIEQELEPYEAEGKIRLKGRYKIKDQMFHTLCASLGAHFEDLILK